jgi:hypothetical protein
MDGESLDFSRFIDYTCIVHRASRDGVLMSCYVMLTCVPRGLFLLKDWIIYFRVSVESSHVYIGVSA